MNNPRPSPHSPKSEELSDREVAELAGVVGGLVGAGITLPGGLRALADESQSDRLRRSLHQIADRIEMGDSLSEAIAAERHRLPDHFEAIVRAAERSGRPQQVLLEAVRFERMSEDLVRTLLARLAFPTVLLCTFALIFQLISRFVTLDLVAVYEDFGVRMPALTSTLIALARWIDSAGWAIPIGSMCAVFLAWRIARRAGRHARRRIVNGVPVFGRIWRNAALAEFAGLLAILVEARLTMPEALLLAGRGVCDPDLISACVGASQEVEKGRSLLDASRDYRLFPSGFDRLLGWAESHQALPDALRLASEVFAAQARSLASILGVFLSATVVSFVVIGVILIVIGLYLPAITLFSV